MNSTQKTIGIAVIILILGGGVLYFFSSDIKEEPGEKNVRVSGAVIDAVSNTPVAGVDLVVGDTSIRTEDAGQFVFLNVSTKQGIRLTHPELLRAIIKLPDTLADEQSTDILFNIQLYNTLVTIIDQEARGKADVLYDYLAPEIQEKVSKEVFLISFERLFEEENITDQEITIRRILRNTDYYNEQLDLRFDNVVEFEVTRPVRDLSLSGINGDALKWYRFIRSNDDDQEWRFIL